MKSIQLTGTATWYAGSNTDTGFVTLNASADGSATVTFQINNWSRSEQQTAYGDSRACTWSGSDGVSHEIEDASCWMADNWFLPQELLQPGHLPIGIGMEIFTPNGEKQAGLLGLRSQTVIGPGKTAVGITQRIQQESTAELVIDNMTLRPTTLRYRLPAPQVSSEPIRVEIRYSEYRQMAGLTVPGHIERYLNGSLQMAIDLTQVIPQN